MIAIEQIEKPSLNQKFNESLSDGDNDIDLGFVGDFENKEKVVIQKKIFGSKMQSMKDILKIENLIKL